MIQACLRRFPHPDARRAVGLLLVLVLVVLAFAGAIHTGDAAHRGHACSVCDAAFATIGATVSAPPIGIQRTDAVHHAARRAPQVLTSLDCDVAHSPRGPPVRS
ncbi:MAG: hypothetical protein K8T90_00120 [Planctomycetes bacterium]|nr:hypothetical protein [Planctomycetota bacterium]